MAISSPKQFLRFIVDRYVASPVDLASLAAFRILFGLMMAAAMIRFIAYGWVSQFYVQPKYYFSYPGFSWVHPWPDVLMHAHFILLALLALGVAFGFFYRTCAALFFLGFTYIELIDQTNYLNHYYLISLLSGLLIFLPANRAWSVDAWRNRALRADAAPAWTLNLLRFQIAIVYLFAGLAKINVDWLLRAEPLRIWLAARSDLPLLGPLLGQLWVAYAASWFGAAFDLSIVFFLLCSRTRRIAYALVIFFHIMTWLLFKIGMFPWVMLVAATVFFPADWPRPFLTRLGAFAASRFRTVPLGAWFQSASTAKNPLRVLRCRGTSRLLPVLGVYAAVQLALPARSFFCASPPAWTCAGFNCAWRVMIAEKTGYVEFYAFDPATGRRWQLSAKDYLTPRQEIMMAQDPDLIRALARRLANDLKAQGYTQVEIHADAFATLNCRPSQRLIDPAVDLAAPVPHGWILPLKN
jgi:vitamin K-dependent gamma-carboxylase